LAWNADVFAEKGSAMPSQVLVGRTRDGVVVRLIGRGTMNESSAFRAVVERSLETGIVVFDATRCEYLDSTFLGCLIGCKKSCEQFPNRRFLIAASPATRTRLFCTSSLDQYFDFIDTCPETIGESIAMDVRKLEPAELGQHVMRCHETLADMGGREAAAFKAVADRIASELANHQPKY
jgi:anti-anti-sigma regulatory factor